MQVVAGILAFLGGWIILCNWGIPIRYYASHKHGSLVPLFGGLLFALAMLIYPAPSVRHWAWIPFVADLGCAFLLLEFLYAVFVLKCFKK